jgi:type VI protein secretion system component Hcp
MVVVVALVVTGLFLARPAGSSAATTIVTGKVTYKGLTGSGSTATSTLRTFSWRAEQVTSTTGGGAGTGKVSFDHPQLVQAVSVLSPALMNVVARGVHLPTVTVVLNRPTTNRPTQKWEFTDVQLTLTSQTKTLSSGLETVAFSFGKVTQSIFATDGTVAATSCFNATTNVAC